MQINHFENILENLSPFLGDGFHILLRTNTEQVLSPEMDWKINGNTLIIAKPGINSLAKINIYNIKEIGLKEMEAFL